MSNGITDLQFSPNLPAPAADQIRAAVEADLPGLNHKHIEYLGEGWACRAYRVGEQVLKFPKRPKYARYFEAEAKLTQALAATLPLPISELQVHAHGVNGLPFTSHAFVPGIQLRNVPAAVGPATASNLGAFLRRLHGFPVKKAQELGVPVFDGPAWRQNRERLLDEVARYGYPLLDSDLQDLIERRFSAYLGDSGNFSFRPVLVHADIDDRNILADPASGELTGVIDFADAIVTDPAFEFASILLGELSRNHVGSNLRAVSDAYGEDIDSMRTRCDFYAFLWNIYSLLHGISTGEQSFMEQSIRGLRRVLDTEGSVT